MEGIIQGGWEYVGAAWGISLTLLALYVIRVELRIRSARAATGHATPDRKGG